MGFKHARCTFRKASAMSQILRVSCPWPTDWTAVQPQSACSGDSRLIGRRQWTILAHRDSCGDALDSLVP
jgi:hypothetical protein